jgi:hypothetical protein
MVRKKKALVIVTGKTKQQMIDEIKTTEFVEEQGIPAPKVKACYLCRREEGEESVLLRDGEVDSIHTPVIKLRLYKTKVTVGMEFGYWLCNECAILLSEYPEEPED